MELLTPMADAKTKRKRESELPMELPKFPQVGEPVQEFRIRLPLDLAQEVEKEVVDSGLPRNRVVINRVARGGHNSKTATLESLIRDMETLLARYSSQQSSVELSKDLLRAVDEILDARPNEVQARVEGLRVVRRAMSGIEQDTTNILARAKKRTE
jgi:hypothetical protein